MDALRGADALRVGAAAKAFMGWGLLAIGLLVLTGADKQLESLLLDYAPDFLIDLTTRI